MTGALAARTIVVATPDAMVRAQIVLYLVQRGDSVISASDFKAPGIGDRVRSTALLIIAESLLVADAAQWREILADHGWTGVILVLGVVASTIDRSPRDLVYLAAPFDIERLIAHV